jgi:hypothetical protein
MIVLQASMWLDACGGRLSGSAANTSDPSVCCPLYSTCKIWNEDFWRCVPDWYTPALAPAPNSAPGRVLLGLLRQPGSSVEAMSASTQNMHEYLSPIQCGAMARWHAYICWHAFATTVLPVRDSSSTGGSGLAMGIML